MSHFRSGVTSKMAYDLIMNADEGSRIQFAYKDFMKPLTTGVISGATRTIQELKFSDIFIQSVEDKFNGLDELNNFKLWTTPMEKTQYDCFVKGIYKRDPNVHKSVLIAQLANTFGVPKNIKERDKLSPDMFWEIMLNVMPKN